MNKKAGALILAFAICLAGIFLWFIFGEQGGVVSDLPDSNGYDELTAAGQLLTPLDNDESEGRLRAYLEENAQALQLARSGLEKECRVPVQYTETWLIQDHQPKLTAVKRLAQAFAAEGKAAELDQRWDAAAESYRDAVRLGNKIREGGLLIDHLVGVACEAVGLNQLDSIVRELSQENCQELVRSFETIDRDMESRESIWRQERVWAQRTYGLGRRIGAMIQTRSIDPIASIAAQTEPKIHQVILQRRTLTLRLAARAYELEMDKRPDKASDLVPTYLRAVPVDPESGDNVTLDPIAP